MAASHEAAHQRQTLPPPTRAAFDVSPKRTGPGKIKSREIPSFELTKPAQSATAAPAKPPGAHPQGCRIMGKHDPPPLPGAASRGNTKGGWRDVRWQVESMRKPLQPIASGKYKPANPAASRVDSAVRSISSAACRESSRYTGKPGSAELGAIPQHQHRSPVRNSAPLEAR